jgi:hypothetical protein
LSFLNREIAMNPCWLVRPAASYVVHRLSLVRVMLLACASPLCAGCYSYTVAQPGAIEQGATVRARITPAAGATIAPLLGSTPRTLTGKVISNLRDTVIVEVPAVTQAEIGSAVQTLHQRVSLAKGDVLEWEVRRLDRGRTYALVGGVALVIGGVLFNSVKGELGQNGHPGDGGADARVPAFRISP